MCCATCKSSCCACRGPLPHPDRVDRLRPEEQLTLKVASVLGLTIYRQLLQARPRFGCYFPRAAQPCDCTVAKQGDVQGSWHDRL